MQQIARLIKSQRRGRSPSPTLADGIALQPDGPAGLAGDLANQLTELGADWRAFYKDLGDGWRMLR